MNRLYHALTAMLDYVFVNNDVSRPMHTTGALYLGPRCVFLRAQIYKIKIGRTLLKKTGWGKFADGRDWTSVSSGGGSINTTVSYCRPFAAFIYISGIAVPVAHGVRPHAAGMGIQ